MRTGEPIPISALQHWAYCPRQCALIHLEQAFDENLHTLRGRVVHQKVDTAESRKNASVRVERALPLWSERMGLLGRADVVEFWIDGTPYPVEYKNGNRHKLPAIAACDDVQLAAQAICLEEMVGRRVPEGAIFYAASKRRRAVTISVELRQEVEAAVGAVRQLLEQSELPPPITEHQRCAQCSLKERCQPEAIRMLKGGWAARDLLAIDD